MCHLQSRKCPQSWQKRSAALCPSHASGKAGVSLTTTAFRQAAPCCTPAEPAGQFPRLRTPGWCLQCVACRVSHQQDGIPQIKKGFTVGLQRPPFSCRKQPIEHADCHRPSIAIDPLPELLNCCMHCYSEVSSNKIQCISYTYHRHGSCTAGATSPLHCSKLPCLHRKRQESSMSFVQVPCQRAIIEPLTLLPTGEFWACRPAVPVHNDNAMEEVSPALVRPVTNAVDTMPTARTPAQRDVTGKEFSTTTPILSGWIAPESKSRYRILDRRRKPRNK